MTDRKPSHLDDKSLIWGAIIGFILGAIIWLFHVPKRGDDTRKEIVDNAKSLVGQKQEEDSKEDTLKENRPKYEYFR